MARSHQHRKNKTETAPQFACVEDFNFIDTDIKLPRGLVAARASPEKKKLPRASSRNARILQCFFPVVFGPLKLVVLPEIIYLKGRASSRISRPSEVKRRDKHCGDADCVSPSEGQNCDMTERGGPEQERQPGTGPPNPSEFSSDRTSPEHLSSALTVSTDSTTGTSKRSKKRSSSKGSSGRSRKGASRRILGLLSKSAKHRDKSARNESLSKADASSAHQAATSLSGTSQSVRDLAPTDVTAAQCATNEPSAKNLPKGPAGKLSSDGLPGNDSMAASREFTPKDTVSTGVFTDDHSTKNITAKENSAIRNVSTEKLPAQESSAIMRKYLPTGRPLAEELSMKEPQATAGAANDLSSPGISAQETSARDVTTKDLATKDVMVKDSSAERGAVSRLPSTDAMAVQQSDRAQDSDAAGTAIGTASQEQPHESAEQADRHQATLSSTSPTSPSSLSPQGPTSPRSLTPLLAATASPGSSPEVDPVAYQLTLSVLKGRKLPLNSGELSISPMVEREQTRKNRRVSIALRPMVELISPLDGSPTDQHSLGLEPSSFVGKPAPAGGAELSRLASASGRSVEDACEERHVQVCRPVLKVRPPTSLVDQQGSLPAHPESEPLPHPETNLDMEECPLPDLFPAGAPIPSAAPPHWPCPDDVGSWFSPDAARVRRASCIRRPGQPTRRGSRVSLKDCPGRPPNSPSTIDLLSADAWSDSPYKTGALVLVCCVFLFGVCVLCVFVVQHMLRTPYVAEPAVCVTEDCVEHARRILLTLDTSANPCLSFHSYVCGGKGTAGDDVADDVVAAPAPSHGATANFTRGSNDGLLRDIKPAQRLARAYARQIVAPNLLSGNGNSSTAYKANAALSLCLNRSAERLPGASLASLMRKVGLPWPASSRGPVKFVDVLALLLELSVNWNVGLWFDVRIRRYEGRANTEETIIVLGEPGHVPLLRMEQVGGLDEPAYESTARDVARYLRSETVDAGGGGGDTEDPFKETAALKQLRRDEGAVRGAILNSLSGGDEMGDVFLALKNAGSTVFEGVSASDWTSLLDKYLGVSAMKAAGVNISLETMLLVHNGQLFSRLSKLASEIPAARLLDVVGWIFAYSYAWIENRGFDRLPLSSSGSKTDPGPGVTTRILCTAVVIESFGIAPVAPLFSRMFPVQERAKVTAVLNTTAHTLADAVRSSRGISNATKRKAGGKITAHTFQTLWPPQPFLSLDVLDTLYTPFPSTQPRTFYESWLMSRRAQRASLVRRYYGTLTTLRLRWYTEEVLYVYSLNHIVLGLTAVFPPSYYRHGSPTMTYAGIGFQFARKLVSCVDRRGRFRDYDGASTGASWWLREAGSPECRLDKARSAQEASAISDLYALDASLAAMKKVSDDAPLRLKLLEKLTGTQTFYVSYCSRFCRDLDAREKCDLAMNGSEFRAAFDCQWRVIDRGCLFLFRDYDGASTGASWWLREAGSPECRLDKARSAQEASAISDLYALDASLAAMKKVSDDAPLRLKLLEKLTGTQTFYVSYCSPSFRGRQFDCRCKGLLAFLRSFGQSVGCTSTAAHSTDAARTSQGMVDVPFLSGI
ncbi:hypothetical protein HPB50_006945 [Hyalomma asiaticum]|uniref:Uncharacterized protein n=1 Tax=Hyalomma asiaticum TaxID=266040 RepID=A0ACB7T6G5_HYAAI|nr:hypothetical protein HPB50_006945 [Hyalomma asiaticum]